MYLLFMTLRDPHNGRTLMPHTCPLLHVIVFSKFMGVGHSALSVAASATNASH